MPRTTDWEQLTEPTARDKLFDQITGKPAVLPQSITDFEPSELKLDGKRLDARIEQSVTAGELTRSIEGASTLTLTLSDDHRKLLRSDIFLDDDGLLAPLVIRLPGPRDKLAFSLAQVAKQADDLTLTFEDREIAKLRRYDEPRKANRANTTRAEFLAMLAREAKVPYKSPELHKVQPVGRHKAAKSRTTTRRTSGGDEDGRAGIPRGANLTVKGARASATQIRNMEIANDEAERLNCTRKVRVALNEACIVESQFHNLSGGDGSSVGILQLTAGKPDRNNVESCVRRFLQDGFTGAGGAISLDKRNPSWSPGQIAQACQGSAHPERYDQYRREAEKIVDAYGGDSGSSSTETTTTRTVVKPFYFQRGEGGKREDSWTAIKRLAEEVGWRAFVTEGTLFYVAEEDLFRAKPKMRISEDSPGVDWIDFDWDTGKKLAQATVTCRVDAWQADPGSVIALKDCGPANGKWLVESIQRGLWDAAAQITLRKPMKSKSEPANETKTRSFGGERGEEEAGPTGGSGGAADMVAWVKAQLGTREGTAKQAAWARDIGYSPSDAWCSIFLAYGIKHVAKLSPLPSGVGMAQAWLSWSGGSRVSVNDVKAGDIVCFDWGTGGIADHVALYIGNNRVIGGNQSDNVTNVPFQRGSCVGATRPKYRS